MKRKIVILLMFMMLVYTLSACNNDRDDDEIILWWASGKTNSIIINEAISQYKEDNPEVKIKIVEKPGLDVFNAFRYALNDNRSRPDLAIIDHVYIQSLAHDNLLANLSDLGINDMEKLYPKGLYSANQYSNNMYGFPLSANTIILMYNKTMLKEAGVTDDGTPNGEVMVPKTLNELYEASEKIKITFGENRAFALPINTFAVMQFMSYVGRLGGTLVSEDYKTITIDNNPLVKQALQYWVFFTENGYANKLEFEEGKFYNGQIAFIEMGSWNISKVEGVSDYEFGFSEMVKIDESLPNYSGLGLYSLVIPQKSNNKEEAFKLGKFLSSNTEFQLAFNKNMNLFPVTLEALNDSYYTEDPILIKYASQLEKVIPRPGTPIWPDMEQGIVNMLRSAVIDNNIDRALSSAQNSIQAATDRLLK